MTMTMTTMAMTLMGRCHHQTFKMLLMMLLLPVTLKSTGHIPKFNFEHGKSLDMMCRDDSHQKNHSVNCFSDRDEET